MEREIGGLRCMQVLEQLDAWLAGELNPGMLSQVQAHVAGCTNCARFGGRYAAVVEALRGQAAPPAPELRDRLMDRLFPR